MMRMSLLVAAAVLLSGVPAFSQEAGIETGPGMDVATEMGRIVDGAGLISALDSIAVDVTPSLEGAVTQASIALGDVARRMAGDAELRRSALAAAQGLAELTSSVVARNAEVIQEILRGAADELGRAELTEEVGVDEVVGAEGASALPASETAGAADPAADQYADELSGAQEN